MKIESGLTILIPTFNESRSIEQTLRAALQSEVNQIIVTDNCSTDDTCEVVTTVSRSDPRVALVRLPSNVGSLRNFEFSLMLSNTDLVSWLGAHDAVTEDYYSNLAKTLRDNSVAVMAFGRYQDSSGVDSHYQASLLHPDPQVRVRAFCRHFHDGAMVHGVFRTQSLKIAFSSTPALMRTDASLLPEVLRLGPAIFSPDAVYFNGKPRHETPRSRARRYNADLRSSRIGRPRTYDVLSDQFRSVCHSAHASQAGPVPRSVKIMALPFATSLLPISTIVRLKRLAWRTIRGSVDRTD